MMATIVLIALAPLARAAEPTTFDELPINQLQVIGTHNSYHVRKNERGKRSVAEWNYSHPPLDVQLDRGVRSFELDLHDRDGVFEVFHVPLLDEGTTCKRLADGLATVRKWSDEHPKHVPISFLFELKKEGPGLDKRIKEPDAAALDRLDAILNDAFGPERRISPDDVRGKSATLAEGVRTTGWPTLAASRGKVLFILHDDAGRRDLYLAGHPSLAGRVMFVRSDESRDDAATLILDNPRTSELPRLVKAGYFIRTRADSDLRGALASRITRRDTALASGAQIISTDFPTGEPDAETGYKVEFPTAAAARVDPVNGPTGLAGQAVSE